MKKSLIWPTIAMLISVCILCALGMWQLHRLEWKTALLMALDAEYAKNAEDIPLSISEIDGNYMFRRGTIRGVYDYDHQILVTPRTYNNLPGSHVYTPLRLDDHSWILVNRGWVSQHWTPADETDRAEGTVTVTGLLRAPDHNPFMPDNAPEKNQWYYADPAQIATAENLAGQMHKHILYVEGADNGKYPVAAATKPQLPNNHLQYAIFWFLMAGTLIVIYGLRFLRKEKHHV